MSSPDSGNSWSSTSLTAGTYETESEVAKDDADLAQKSERENLTRAAQALPASDHQQAMGKHLANVAKKYPQAAQERGQVLKNVSGPGERRKLIPLT